MMEQELFQFLAAGGDFATIFFAWAVWKLDRRLYVIEQKLTQGKEL